MQAKCTEPNESELAWLQQNLERVGAFVEQYSPADSGARSLAAVDRAFAKSLEAAPSSNDENQHGHQARRPPSRPAAAAR